MLITHFIYFSIVSKFRKNQKNFLNILTERVPEIFTMSCENDVENLWKNRFPHSSVSSCGLLVLNFNTLSTWFKPYGTTNLTSFPHY